MEKSLITEFLSERTFEIYDAEAGYHYLLLRSVGGVHDVNVDLIFGGVLYVEIPSVIFTIKVSRPCDEKSVELEKKFTTYQSAEYKGELVYSIESNGERFNIVASALWIHVNTLPTSSLVPMCYGDKEGYCLTDVTQKFCIFGSLI